VEAFRDYGAAALVGAVVVFVGVEGWRGLIWLASASSSVSSENVADASRLLAGLAYALTGSLYVRHGGPHHLLTGLSYVLLATAGVYGLLDVIRSWFGGLPGWPGWLPEQQPFLGVVNLAALTIASLVMSAFMAIILISHRRRRD
jgi:hypothetical protein